MSKKKYRITPQGYVTIGATFILIIAIIILLVATSCFGACGGEEDSVNLPSESPTPTLPAATDTASPTSTGGSVLPVITPSTTSGTQTSASPAVSDPGTMPTDSTAPMSTATPAPTATPVGTPELKKDPDALSKPSNSMVKNAASGKLTGKGVNLRQGPSTSTPIVIEDMEKDTELTVYTSDGDFYFVKVNSAKKYGYVAKKFVKLTSDFGEADSENKEDLSDQPDDTVLGTVTASKLAIREKPSTDAKAIGEYTKGKKVYIYYKEGDFYYVKVAGSKTKGYMAAKYIKASGDVKKK